MHEYDAALKLLLRASAGSALGLNVTEWLDTELQQVRTRRADLLGITAGGGLVHLELQSTNQADMPLRMAEYSLATYRQYGSLPKQFVLYVGDAPLRMSASLRGPQTDDPDLVFRYALIDSRDLDGEALLTSPRIEDNVLAILTRLRNQDETIRRILVRISACDGRARRAIFAQFLIISGLRRLEQAVRQETSKMPILNDILEHGVIGPAILQGRREGRQEGRQEGRTEGEQSGRREVVRQLIAKRFGVIPGTIDLRLRALSAPELDTLAIRLLDAERLEDLFE